MLHIAELPFERNGNLILVRVFVNEIALQFCLDTGAGYSFIDSVWADKLGLEYVSDTIVHTLGGEVPAKVVRAHALQIATFKFNNHLLTACSKIPRGDGLVGGDILSRFKVTIDYKKQIVRLELEGRG